MSSPSRSQIQDGEHHLFVKDGYDLVRINVNNLLFIEADDNYVTFHETDKKTIVRMTLNAVLEKLGDKRFIRVHKSYIVSIPRIEKAERHQVLLHGHKIPVSAGYRDTLVKHLG